jgi:hypothetical protein
MLPDCSPNLQVKCCWNVISDLKLLAVVMDMFILDSQNGSRRFLSYWIWRFLSSMGTGAGMSLPLLGESNCASSAETGRSSSPCCAVMMSGQAEHD